MTATPAPVPAVHPVDEVLPTQSLFTYGLQHVFSMYAGIVAVPFIVANAIGLEGDALVRIISASFFMCGLATLIQTIGFGPFGARLPIVQGTTFAAVSTMIVIGKQGGLPAIFGATIAAGLFTVLIAPFFSRMLRFFPPVVAGTVIMMIGISLLPVAIRWAGGGVVTAPTFGDPANLALAGVTMVIVLLITRFAQGFLGRIAVLAGLVLGTIIAAIFGKANFSGVGSAAWVGFTPPLHFGAPTFEPIAILLMCLVMLVVMVETTADILAIGEIVDRPADGKMVADGLRADGLSTALSGLFNAFAFSAFAQNVGLVRFSGIKSRFVVAAAGIILMLMGLFPKLGALVASIPLPVLGGAGLVLFGSVAAAGIQTLAKVNMGDTRNLIIVALSLALGVIPSTVPTLYHNLPEAMRLILDSGITSAAIAAILLNILFNIVGNNRAHPSSLAPTTSNAPEAGDLH